MGFGKLGSSIRTFILGMVLLQGFSLTALAQFIGPPQQMFVPGTSWQRAQNPDGSCFFYGQQPQGSVIYAWEDSCTGKINAWGYALDYTNRLDSIVWVNYTEACGVYSRAWQWYDEGNYAEYVGMRNVVASCTMDYYSGVNKLIEVRRPNNQPSLWINPSLGCAPNLTAMSVRRDLAYDYLKQVLMLTNPNTRDVEKAWHAYNRAIQTFSTCQRQLAAEGPADWHYSR
jgi:hypothetical protein